MELFPLHDIRVHGLRTPILLDSAGRLLDGRNRLRAMLAAQLREKLASGALANLPKTQVTEKAALTDAHLAAVGPQRRPAPDLI